MYNIEFSTRSEKFLKKAERGIAERIIKSLQRLKENSVPSDVKFIGRDNGEKVFRYRIGDYRTLYKIKESKRIILIIKIDKRPRIY